MASFNIWDAIGMGGQGDQTNPNVMSQLAEQAASSAIPPFLRAKAPPQVPSLGFGPQNPMVVQPPPQKVPLTAQPTTQPLGTLPQEIQPEQPVMAAAPPPMDPMALYTSAVANAKLPDNARGLKALELGQKSFGEQEAGYKGEIDKLKEGLARYASTPRGIDLTPGAATIDSLFGSNLSKGIQAPETAAQKMHNMQDMQGKIAQLQGEIPKTELEALKNKLAQLGYMDERQIKLEIAKLNAAGHIAGTGARIGTQEKRLNFQTEKEARAAVNNDSMLKQYGPRLEGAAKIGELIQSARDGKVVSNGALLGQLNAEVARLETGSQSPGLGQSEKTELHDAAAEIGSLRDRITGDPQDAVHPQVLDAAGKLVNELSSSYMKGIDSRIRVIRAGMAPNQRNIVNDKHHVLKQTYAPRFGGWKGLPPEPGEIEDGHQFNGGDPSNPANWSQVNGQ